MKLYSIFSKKSSIYTYFLKKSIDFIRLIFLYKVKEGLDDIW